VGWGVERGIGVDLVRDGWRSGSVSPCLNVLSTPLLHAPDLLLYLASAAFQIASLDCAVSAFVLITAFDTMVHY
jgi:hypothetical protein